METLAQDVRYTVRTISRFPSLALVVIVSISLGIAANATVFSIAKGLLWGVLPVPDSERLVSFPDGSETFSYPDYMDYRNQTAEVFEGGLCAYLAFVPASMGGAGEPERVWGQLVSGNYFSVLGVTPALGRGILLEEDKVVGLDQVVVLSDTLWRRRFGSDPGVIGRGVLLNGRRYTVVGVTPRGFKGTDNGIVAEFWAPLAMAEQLFPDITQDQARTRREDSWLSLNARLKPGVTLTRAEAAMNIVKRRINATYHREGQYYERPIILAHAGGLIAGSQAQAHRLIGMLMVVGGCVLLVACANVANLLLARATGRQREVAIRLAMGAGRGRLIRQLLTESILLALAGAAVGVGCAAIAVRAISRVEVPLPVPVVFNFDMDLRVLACTVILSILAGILFGLAPALRATRPDLQMALKKESPGFGRIRGFELRNALVIAQVALSLVLLAGAGLFLRSLQNASSIDSGMKPQNILILAVDPKLHNYSSEKTKQFLSHLHDRVSALPGVRAVSFVDSLPLNIGGSTAEFHPKGRNVEGDEGVNADIYRVGAGFFESLGIPLLRGRDFNRQSDDEHVAIINQTMAQHMFGNEDPLGRQMTNSGILYTIIGIARNSKSHKLAEAPSDCAYLFLEGAPQKVMSGYGISMLVKTSVHPRTLLRPVRMLIHQLDPSMAIFNTGTMQEHVDKSLLVPKVCAALLAVFGAVGLTLAAIGLYGVMSYSARRRTHEIGIRMALGAKPAGVLAMVIRQGLILTSLGLAIGLAIAMALGRFTASLLYGISGTDRLTLIIVSAVLFSVALAASLFPAYRAAHVEPITALRYE
jgi:putative ABC transport system permease protein